MDIEQASRQGRTHPGTSPIVTIGHSNHPLDVFLRLLSGHGVVVLADIRSAPYSRYNPQFSRDPLATALSRCGIAYRYFGRELGGRPQDRACYEGGRVRYDRVAETECFREGIARVMDAAAQHRIALMCAEREPLECHRTILVSPVLEEEGLSVAHIHADGRLEAHEEAMDRLIGLAGLARDDLFRSREEIVAEALLRQEGRVAYREAESDAGGETP